MLVALLGDASEAVEQVGPKGILIVDDEPDIRESLHSLLESEYPDAKVFSAATGDDALLVLAENDIHLVITDYRMPGMDGLELLARVKRNCPGARRALITAYDPQNEQHNMLSELDFYLRKPIHIGLFMEATNRSLAAPT